MITVLLADDHAFILNSLRTLLDAADDIQVVAMAPDGVEAVVQAGLYCPNVAIIDISMPLMDGIEATKQICAICPHTRVLTISMFDNPEYVRRSLQAGALGYVLKDEVFNDLVNAVRAIHKGDQYFSQKVASIAQYYTQPRGTDGLPGQG
jgi:DNA-binding NarL/FixJ family response regulator